MGITCYAIHSGLSGGSRERIKHEFNTSDNISVLVLSYLCSNEGINLHYQCWNTIMIEQGQSYSSEHQAWSRVRRIGQKNVQHTERLININTVDIIIEKAQRDRQSPMLYAYGIMEKAGNVDSGLVHENMVGSVNITVLKKQVIGQGEGGGPIDVEED